MTENEKHSFITELTHGVRNPMNAIMGNCDLIKQEAVSLKVKEYVNDIRNGAAELLELFNNALDIFRLGDSKFSLNTAEYNFSGVLAELSSYIDPIAVSRHLSVTYDIDQQIPCKLIGDVRRVTQMLKKLVLNAVLHLRSGEVEIIGRFEKIDDMNIRLLFTVHRKGTELLDTESDRVLYEDIKAYDGEKMRNVAGTGINLLLARGLAQYMGGNLVVDADDPAKVTLSFIQEAVGTGTLEDQKNSMYLDDFSFRIPFKVEGIRALIVDDNEINRKVAYYRLKLYGIDADTAESGEQVVSLVQRVRYDIIFMDHMMPGLDGTDITKIIREMIGFSIDHVQHNKQVPIIALTANVEIGAEEFFLEKGMNDYLSKPIETESLERVLRTWIPMEHLRFESEFDISVSDKQHALAQLGIRYQEAVEALEGNKDEYDRILLSFTRTGEENIRNIQRALDTKDRGKYLIGIRGLLGVMQTIGAEAVSEKLRKVEDACMEGDYDLIEEETAEVTEQTRRLLDALAALLQRDNKPMYGEEKSEITDAELVRLLKLLVYEIREYHIDEANQLFYELAQKQLSDEGLLEEIHVIESDFANSFKYNEVADALEGIINKLVEE